MNKKRGIIKALAAAALAALTLAAPVAAGAQGRDEVRQALHAGDHAKAIALALEALRGDPENAEVRFLLARAYASAGRNGEAEAVLDRLLAEHPADADLIVLKGRLLCRRGDLDGAEKAFRRASEAEPRSADALAGLADVASWRGQLDASLVYARRALDLDADHAGALFRVGSVLLWQGDYGKARGYLARAAELEPMNADFRRALDRAVPLFVRKAEVRLSGRNEHWSDGRSDCGDLGLAVLFGLFDDRVRLVAKMGRSWRAGGRDDQLGLEAYPRLWKGAYGYFDLSLAPGAAFIPRSAVHAEVYQAFLTRCEASLGLRRIGSAAGDAAMAVASAAAYLGPWYPNVRLAWADAHAGTAFTWTAGVRRYFAGASYAWAAFGRGSRSPETGPAEEILAGPAWLFEAGFDVYAFRDVKLRGYASRREGIGGADSTAVSLTVGYRF
ncbi:MAG TPA: YaiO family outer membrane beta-barrel protein [Candidatus Aminicenantes bacterium]|nr:YaiO family outer membrane beta-barrel protein [Candidatus Aminicenantes bacterium]